MPANPGLRTPPPGLQLTQWLVVALAAIAVAAMIVGVWFFPTYAAANSGEFVPTQAWTPETLAAATTQLGWPPMTVPWIQFTRDSASYLVYIALGLVILSRGPRTRFGVYVALTFVATAYANTISKAAISVVPAFAILSQPLSAIAWQLTFILFYLFPDGRFVPRWTRWLILPWIGLNLVGLPGLNSLFAAANNWWLPIPLVLSAIGSQIYRYFRRADPLQRIQTKWIVYSVGLLAPIVLAYGFLVPLTPDRAPAADALANALSTTVFWATLSWAGGVMIPIAFAIAILRYRLWDIDLIIRKTLVYGVLTALLGLVYAGSVILLQQLFEAVSGQGSPLAVVLSTLLAAALFAPSRRRVQNAVDRRFFRRKVNAAAALAAFAAAARDETDLDALTARLAGVVQEAMQPEEVTLWLASRSERR